MNPRWTAMSERDELVARLTDPAGEFRWADRQRAADQIERDGREIERLRSSLQRAYDHVLRDAPDWFMRHSHEQQALEVERAAARAALNGEAET